MSGYERLSVLCAFQSASTASCRSQRDTSILKMDQGTLHSMLLVDIQMRSPDKGQRVLICTGGGFGILLLNPFSIFLSVIASPWFSITSGALQNRRTV